MDVRTLTRSVLCLLVAASATGCETLRGVRPGPAGSGYPTVPPEGSPPGTGPAAAGEGVVAAGGAPAGVVARSAPGDNTPASGLPAPRPQPGWPSGVPLPPAGAPPQPMPPAPGAPPPLGGADSHLRNYPTVSGQRLNLAPYEVPTDRVIDLTTHLESALAQNRNLIARIKEMEAQGVSREQALAEAVREIETVTAEAQKARAAFQTQVLVLQGKIKQLEEEDIFFLRAVIEALEKLLPPEKKP